MRVKFTAPQAGKTTIRVDDHDGATGFRVVLKDVPVVDLRAHLGPQLDTWAQRRAAVKAARKAQKP